MSFNAHSNFKQEGMNLLNTQSISAISNIDQQSEFTDVFSKHRIKVQEPSQYKIKIKKPSQNNFFLPNNNNINMNNSQYQGVNYSLPTVANKQLYANEFQKFNYEISDDQHDEVIFKPQQNPLKQTITGYQITKEAFSQQQMLEAFKVIDINKDQAITEQDIIFFLEYIKEPFTMEEVKQMIQMVSTDKKKVTYEDFKKIGKGKGSIIPFADAKIPDKKMKIKDQIYKNIKSSESNLYDQDPQVIVHASKNQIISQKKYQENKKAPIQKIESINLIEEGDQFQFIQKVILIRSEEDFLRRREFFEQISMVNIQEILKNYRQYQEKYITWVQISKILQISQKDAKALYGLRQVFSKYVVMQAIAFSRLNKIKRLELSLNELTKRSTVNFKQIWHLLKFLKGQDKKQQMKKKLLTVLKSRNISKTQQIDKNYLIELINQNNSNFIF